MLSRRSLIFTGSAAVGLSLIGNAPLAAAVQSEDRYTRVLAQANALSESAGFRMTPGYGKTAEFDAWCRRGDVLIRDLMTLFPEEPDSQMVRDLFDGVRKFPMFDEASLRETVPGIVPIAMIREMVNVRRLPFHMHRQEAFLEFAEKNRHHVMP